MPYHPNGVSFLVDTIDGKQHSETYYSIGGGFIEQEQGATNTITNKSIDLPFPINKAEDLLHWCRKTGLPIHEIVWENESAWRTEAETRKGIMAIWQTMQSCIYRGCHTEGYLPGGLRVKRRASVLNKKLLGQRSYQNHAEWMEEIGRAHV